MSKVRQYWVEHSADGYGGVKVHNEPINYRSFQDDDELVHVIEAAPILAELKKIRKDFEFDSTIHKAIIRLDKLIKEIEGSGDESAGSL